VLPKDEHQRLYLSRDQSKVKELTEICVGRELQAKETASAKALGQNELVCLKGEKGQCSCSREK